MRDFRLLLAGTSTSLLGDQFALIATPWLVLQLSDDPLALGIVLALGGIPRAVFMLIGGAVTDRVSPRRVMLVADIVRGVLTAAMAAAVLTGTVQMWMVYGFALGFGLVAGFAVPAENSIVPTLVRRDDLQAGNGVIMGATQLTSFVGPTLAGAVIAGYSSSTLGIGLAFGIDTVTFAVSATTFALDAPARRIGRVVAALRPVGVDPGWVLPASGTTTSCGSCSACSPRSTSSSSGRSWWGSRCSLISGSPRVRWPSAC